MPHVVTVPLALGLGITVMTAVSSAQVNVPPNRSWTNKYGNQIVPLEPGGGSGGCYMDGVAVCPSMGSCYEPSGDGGH